MPKPSQENPTGAPLVVLDTNVVLDWLVFRDPHSAPIGAAIEAGLLRWIATPAMRDELAHVLARGGFDAWRPDLTAVRLAWERHCEEAAAPVLGQAAPTLRCTDPDDQKFIDLAVARGARWLLSRDRAVLKLARRMREHGIEVATPQAWALSSAGNAIEDA